jgi:phosphatidate cytidylyltransferase
VTRIFSALAILSIVLVVILFLPLLATVLLADIVALLAFVEYAKLARSAGIQISSVPACAATLVTVTTIALAPHALPIVLMTSTVVVAVIALTEETSEQVLAQVASAAFAILYLGLSIGAIAAVQVQFGPKVLMVLLGAVIVSDTAQYYGGRTIGRRLLAPSISPKKTIEGAVCGVVASAAALLSFGGSVMPGLGSGWHALFGVMIALLGIAGDLFESRLKRASVMKDSSALIPGHGGVLDRIDGLLFAAPVYYVVMSVLVRASS